MILYYIGPVADGLLFPTAGTQNRVPHIVANKSIDGALAAITAKIGDTLDLWEIDNDAYYAPSLSEAPMRDISEEVWLAEAIIPKYIGVLEITERGVQKCVELNEQLVMMPTWKYTITGANGQLLEDTRTMLVSKSNNAGPYKNQSRGKNRMARSKYSKVANSVKAYNSIDMNKLFKQDILEISIPVTGETDSYTVKIKMEGVIAEIAKNIKNNQNKFEFRTVIQALTKVFNSSNIWVKCDCADYKYRFAHWNIIKNVSVDDTSKDPGPGKGIRNPNDDKGRGCKHVLLCLKNGNWLMKVAAVIKNYITYAEEHLRQPFLKLIFPKLYGVPFDEAKNDNLLPEDFELKSNTDIIDSINDWAKNRGKIKRGSNINPVFADKLEKEQKANKQNEPEGSKKPPEQPEDKKQQTGKQKEQNETDAEKTKPEETSGK